MNLLATMIAPILALVGTAADAQTRFGDYPGGVDAQAQIEREIERGVENGVMSASEASSLRPRLVALRQLDAHYSRNGFSASERQDLTRRGEILASQVRFALRNGQADDEEGRVERYPGSVYHPSQGGTLTRHHRGDRFDGDFQVGQSAPAELVMLPARYREAFPETPLALFRYNQGRIYEVDPSTGLIRRMIDARQ